MCYRTGKYTVCRRVRVSFSPEILHAGTVKGKRGTEAKTHVGPIFFFKLCANFSISGSIRLFHSVVLSKEILACFEFELPRPPGAVLVRLLINEDRERLVRKVFQTFDSRAGLDYEVTDPHCQAQHGSAHDHVFVPKVHF